MKILIFFEHGDGMLKGIKISCLCGNETGGIIKTIWDT